MKKRKKGFTLIELLAIIVILAVIAVITVPIILNIIENSKKGAASDSAYGYKDAVQKNYLSKFPNESLDGDYLINSDGDLTNSEGEVIHDIEVSGTIPSGGYLNIQKNVVVTGCIQIDEYAVNVLDGRMQEPQKTTCGEQELEAPDPIVYNCSDSNYTPDNESWFTTTNVSGDLFITGFSDSHPADNTDLKLPCSIGGSPVKGIFYSAFSKKGLTSVVIPEGIRELYEGSFSSNNINSLAIPSSVTTIKTAAFSDNKIQKLLLSNGLQTVGSSAFVNNKIKEINIPSSVTTIGGGAFNNNLVEGDSAFIYDRSNSTRTISYAGKNKEVTIPSNVRTVGEITFLACEIKSVVIPEGVTTIEKQAFASNNLTNVVIPNSVVEIGQSAFEKNDLREVTIGTGAVPNNHQGAAFLKKETSNPNLTTIHNLSGQSFNWGTMINYGTGNSTANMTFVTGIVTSSFGNVEIVGS